MVREPVSGRKLSERREPDESRENSTGTFTEETNELKRNEKLPTLSVRQGGELFSGLKVSADPSHRIGRHRATRILTVQMSWVRFVQRIQMQNERICIPHHALPRN